MSTITDVMIDIETLSTQQNAVVLSIGAVGFCCKDGSVTFQNLNLSFGTKDCRADQISKGRHVSKDTVKWWKSQSEQARAVFNSKNVHDVRTALNKLSQFVRGFNANVRFWGNGSDFDIGILSSLYVDYGIESPWSKTYRNTRCFRTMKGEHGQLVKNVPVRKGTHHNALADAESQARYLIEVYKALALLEKNND